jgi:TonB-linked SusC/RagA family outer membrane protein
MKHHLFLLISMLVLLSPAMWGQNHNITGTVVDTKGEPVIGASVKMKDAKVGVITNVDGKFSMNVSKASGELLVSYIGYLSQTVKYTANGRPIKVVLTEDVTKLDEVVVVGYGTQKKSSLTSSVEVIKHDDLMKIPTTRLDEALAGQVAGLQVMSSTGDPSTMKETDMRIRVTGGITSNPLLVIDGVPRYSVYGMTGETRLSDLNPDDIESISVLKDAAAAAVYGVRAANGVILVKTKRGTANSKVSISYHGQYNLTKATQLPEFLNGYEFAQLYNRAAATSQQHTPFTDAELEMIRDHTNPNVYADTNMLDYLKDYGYTTSHSVSLSGGSQNVRYYLSLGYSNVQGLYSGVGRSRYNYSMKVDMDLLKGLTLSVDMDGIRSNNKQTSDATLESAYNYSPLQPLEFEDGKLASISHNNPLINVRGLGGNTKTHSRLNSTTVNLRYEAAWLKGLSMYVRETFDSSTSERTTFHKPVELYIYDPLTKQEKIDEQTIYPQASITIREEKSVTDNKLLEAGIDYTHTFAEKHDVSAMLVANYQTKDDRSLVAENDKLPAVYPEILAGSYSNFASGSKSKVQRASLIGRLKYGFDNRYFIEGNFRVDGSVKFHPDHRWAFFPTISASWVLSNEKFFQNWNQQVLSNVKFRASTGLLGSEEGVNDYDYLNKYIALENKGYEIGGVYRYGLNRSGNYPNPNLEWGKSRDYNGGVDLGFWGDRIGVTFEYYTRYRTNMTKELPGYLFPPSTGKYALGTPYINMGKVKAWGWDLTISHSNRIRDFQYNCNITMGWGRDKYLDYGDESNQLPQFRKVGHSTSDTMMYQSLGLFQSQSEIDNWTLDQDGRKNKTLAPGDIKYKDQNDDGVLDYKDYVYLGNATFPDLTGSLSLGCSYKGVYVSVLFNGVKGYMKEIDEKYSLYSGQLPRFQKYHLTDTWSESNPNAMYPRIKFCSYSDNNRETSDFWVRKCNFLRLHSLNFGYSFPLSLIQKYHLKSASIAFQAGNLFTWSSLKHMDPETPRGYPVQRTYGVSVNLGF